MVHDSERGKTRIEDGALVSHQTLHRGRVISTASRGSGIGFKTTSVFG